MTINLSAYDTTVGSVFPLKHVRDHVAQASVSGDGAMQVFTGQHETAFPLFLIQGGTSFSDAVPRFTHPLPIANPLPSADKHPTVLALDVRNYGRWYTPTQRFEVRNGIEYSWQMRRAVLNQIWMSVRPETLRDLSPLPAAAYAALISDCVARKFSLNPHERMSVAVLAAYFYYGLFTDAEEFSEAEKPFLLGKIAQFTHVPSEQVFGLLDKMPVIHGLPSLIEAIHQHVANVALENLNLGTFLSLLVGLWWGSESREIMGVALEHVPTWLSVIDASFSSAVYKRSVVARMAQNFDQRGSGLAFSRSLEVLMGGSGAVMDPRTGVPDPTYRDFFHA